jgi:hypothetical protein
MRRLFTGLALWCFAVAAHASISVTPSPSTGTHTVSWAGTPPPNFVRYELKESFNGGTAALVYSGTATSRLLTGRAPGSYTYTFDVCQTFYIFGSPVVLCLPALNPDLTPQQATVTVTNAPPVPGPISGPSSDTDGAYTIAWGSSTGATSYELQEQVNGAAWSTIQNTAATSKSLSGKTNATYGYQVRACNGTACSAWTAVHNVQVLNTPSARAHYAPIRWQLDDCLTAATGRPLRLEGGSRRSFAVIQSSLGRQILHWKINNSYGYRAGPATHSVGTTPRSTR